MKNKSNIVRSLKDENNLYNKFSAELNKLPLIESAIMYRILSNNDDWIINKKQIQKNSGVGRDLFNKCWKNLIQLGYIYSTRIQGGCNYIIFENPLVRNSVTTENGALTITNYATIAVRRNLNGKTGRV